VSEAEPGYVRSCSLLRNCFPSIFVIIIRSSHI
jgi:hypothetical protein